MPGLCIRNWFDRVARYRGHLWRRIGAPVLPREFLWLYAAAALLLVATVGTAGVGLLCRQAVVIPPAVQEQTVAPPAPAASPLATAEAVPPAAATAAAPAAPAAAPEKPLPPVTGQVQMAFGWQYYARYNDWRFHQGVDIAVPADTVVQAATSGMVSAVYTDASTGLTVEVAGGPGKIIYGSLAQAAVHVGDAVQRGQTLGRAGTCPLETDYHLHFAVADASGYLDPVEFISQLAR